MQKMTDAIQPKDAGAGGSTPAGAPAPANAPAPTFAGWLASHRLAVYLVVTFALTWGYWFAVVYPMVLPALLGGQGSAMLVGRDGIDPASAAADGIQPGVVQLAVGAGMLFPAIGVLVTRLITREGFRGAWIAPKNFRRTWKYYAAGWFGPIVLMAVGAAAYFLAFPGDFDPEMTALVASSRAALDAAGQGALFDDDALRSLLLLQLPIVLVAPLLNCLTCFGEEWGWRGYMLPKMAEKHSITFTLVAGGLIWGVWHAPMTVLGHNYGLGYAGYPVTGILAMCCFTTVIGAFLSWLTLRSGSCLPAVFAHGALNGTVAAGTMFSATGGSPFVGPVPTGILGGIAFVVVAVLCYRSLAGKGVESN